MERSTKGIEEKTKGEEMKALVRMEFGSIVYGTQVPTSDHDLIEAMMDYLEGIVNAPNAGDKVTIEVKELTAKQMLAIPEAD